VALPISSCVLKRKPPHLVVAGPVPTIHVFDLFGMKFVDARDFAGA
jgi:hypothetical protein